MNSWHIEVSSHSVKVIIAHPPPPSPLLVFQQFGQLIPQIHHYPYNARGHCSGACLIIVVTSTASLLLNAEAPLQFIFIIINY